jgi:hypothetical protein
MQKCELLLNFWQKVVCYATIEITALLRQTPCSTNSLPLQIS